MKTATLTLDPAFRVGPVHPRVFGSFVEHMGRCVYTGIYEPGHPSADADGLREDVLALTREMGVSVVRYPGGNFVSGYRWEDGVGPVEDRPARLDLAWQSLETNAFGLHEFMTWADRANVEPMMAVNLGTRGVQEAVDLLEYTNHPGGTALSDRRAANGRREPYGIGLWCLGNEMDGPWQIGHKTAEEYGRLAQETGKAMKFVDPSIELVACGSSNAHMPTFGSWEATVLSHCYDEADYISLHAYYGQDGDLASFLASAVDMDAFIEGVVATADHVRAKLGKTKRIRLSFDEWNVWYTDDFAGGTWEQAPRMSEDLFNVADAVVVGSLLISLLKHADRVGVACQAQLANLLAPIRTEPGGPAWRQTIFHPFAHAAAYAKGDALRVVLDAPRQETAKYGDVPLVDAVATQDEEGVTVFAVNRDTEGPIGLTLDLRAFPGVTGAERIVLADEDRTAANTAAEPERVTPRRAELPVRPGEPLLVELPPVSWNVIRLSV
ncbi:alpha-N-arabinofuranosidase [Actinomadura sp. DC4]|uniref:arabinosylfuranosidase ArfA n=1 Tax=Actinomadura sp. DC4 TaxID=3055069 RepID=UPI0025AF2F87|nr:alpha-N-arabinofuranosidase [Actinomadura sp. DC4]MDN3358219.1 alpha-N-arabinofuranosidase [Actinomadura sp. DC4]